MQFAAETVWVRYVSSCVYGLCLFIRLMSKGFCFAETFGCCRFVYNWALNLKITAYKERKETLGNVYLTNLMKSEPKAEHEWLSEISSQSLQSALRNPDTAYTDFFRNTHAVGFPRFKSRKDRQSFLCPQHWRVDFSKSTITIPKAKDIPAVPRIKSGLNLDK